MGAAHLRDPRSTSRRSAGAFEAPPRRSPGVSRLTLSRPRDLFRGFEEVPIDVLTIRDAQMTVFRREALAAFVRRLSSDILAERPKEERLHGPTLARAVEEGVEGALSLGLFDPAQVARFVACRLRHGEGFPSAHPWAQAVVDDPLLTPAQALARIEAGPTEAAP